MPANKYALLRYRIIDSCLTNEGVPFPNKEYLRQKCEDALYGSQGIHISESTIEKDIWAMRNESQLGYYAPIAFDRASRGYYYTEEEYSINQISLNEYDLDAIKSATQVLQQFKGIPLFQQYESAINKIINRVQISANPQDDSIDKYMQFESLPASKGDEYLSPILEAIKFRNIVEVEYRKFQDDKTKTYQLSPYLLKEYKNRWYVIAFEPLRESYLTFALERIQDVNVLEEHFVRDDKFDSDKFFKYSIGITQVSDAPKDVVLSFSPLQGKYVLSQPLHHSQKTVLKDDKEIRVKLKVYETYELIQQILSYGKDVSVIKPITLKNRIVTILKESLKMNQ